MILGFCNKGPYKHIERAMRIEKLSWFQWHYADKYIDNSILERLNDVIDDISNEDVKIATWEMGIGNTAVVLREGTIDYVSYKNGMLILTTHLHKPFGNMKHIKIPIANKLLLEV